MGVNLFIYWCCFLFFTSWGIERQWGLNTWSVEINKQKLLEEQP
jgi:hypothetical protein